MSNTNDAALCAEDTSISRRALVFSLATAAAGITGISCHFGDASDSRVVLRSAFASIGDAAKAGRVYLRQAPHEANLPQLMQFLFPSGVPTNVREIRRILATARDRDLHESRTLVLGGWLVARTEARWCALAHLLSDTA